MNSKQSELDAFLNLPTDPQGSKPLGDDQDGKDNDKEEVLNPAVELIRRKVEAAYAAEPDAATESEEVRELGPVAKLSKHQKFIYELTSSGKSLEEIQVAWHDYYAGLPDAGKHQVWQEFYSAQAATARHPAAKKRLADIETEKEKSFIEKPTVQIPDLQKQIKTAARAVAGAKDHLLGTIPKRTPKKAARPFHSLLFGISAGIVVIFVVLFSFFNERFIAPFIQPSRSLSNIPLITEGTAVGSNPEIVIPKINVEIPVVYGVNTIDESAIDAALENGVVHYADTAMPGQDGNLVIVGHSSNNIFNKGRYKFAFVLLSRLEPGDTFYLQKDSKRYTYQVYQKKIVSPNDVSILGPTDKLATATLVTCDPPGTSLHRLVVTGEQINPDPSNNSPKTSNNNLATQSKIIPGNSQSLWARFTHWLSH